MPRYRRTHPYQVLPYQWSDHVVRADGVIEHREYLHREDSDPRQAFLESLLEALGSRGTIVVYSPYENTQLGALARTLRGNRRRIRMVQRRLLDLLVIARQHYYHPDQDGSFSLKVLTPALVPTLPYGAITDGNEAGAAYVEMIASGTTLARKNKLERALRRYCRTDTLAMVKVWSALKRRAVVRIT